MSTIRVTHGNDGKSKIHLIVDFRSLYFDDSNYEFSNNRLELAYATICHHKSQGSASNGMSAYIKKIMQTPECLDSVVTHALSTNVNAKYIAYHYNLYNYKTYFDFCSSQSNFIALECPPIQQKEFIFDLDDEIDNKIFTELDALAMKGKVQKIVSKTLAYEYYHAFKTCGEHKNYFLNYSSAQTLNSLIKIFREYGESELFYTSIECLLHSMTMDSLPIVDQGVFLGFEDK